MISCKIAEYSTSFNGLRSLTGRETGTEILYSLARSLSGDIRLKDTLFVLRRSRRAGAVPGLYTFGDLGPADLERLRHLTMQISRADRSARYVDYAGAERLTGVLAEGLTKRYGRRELLGFEYRPIPRGGYIVMGMLSYALGLPLRDERPGIDDPARPLVFVDDCVLSGLRFKQRLEGAAGRRVVLAVLFAPAGLEDAPGVQSRPFDCVSAADLPDLGPEFYGASYGTWRREWSERLGDAVLWTGQPEHLCFPWSEPESSFCNTVNGEIERGFNFAPSERCLRHRFEPLPQPDVGSPAVRLPRIHEDGPGPIDAAPGVVAAEMDEGRIAAADFSDSPGDNSSECYLLEGSAADMWKLIIQHGTIEKASLEMASLYNADPEVLLTDMTGFADSLIEMGLLLRG